MSESTDAADIADKMAKMLKAGRDRAKSLHDARTEPEVRARTVPVQGRGVGTRPAIDSPLHGRMPPGFGSTPMETQQDRAA